MYTRDHDSGSAVKQIEFSNKPNLTKLMELLGPTPERCTELLTLEGLGEYIHENVYLSIQERQINSAQFVI